jgi:hypothetical protein
MFRCLFLVPQNDTTMRFNVSGHGASARRSSITLLSNKAKDLLPFECALRAFYV